MCPSYVDDTPGDDIDLRHDHSQCFKQHDDEYRDDQFFDHEPDDNLLDERDVIKYDADHFAIAVGDHVHATVKVVDRDTVVVDNLSGIFDTLFIDGNAHASDDYSD